MRIPIPIPPPRRTFKKSKVGERFWCCPRDQCSTCHPWSTVRGGLASSTFRRQRLGMGVLRMLPKQEVFTCSCHGQSEATLGQNGRWPSCRCDGCSERPRRQSVSCGHRWQLLTSTIVYSHVFDELNIRAAGVLCALKRRALRASALRRVRWSCTSSMNSTSGWCTKINYAICHGEISQRAENAPCCFGAP